MKILNNIIVALGLASLLISHGAEANDADHKSRHDNTGWSNQGSIPFDSQGFSMNQGNQEAANGSFLGDSKSAETEAYEDHAAGLPLSHDEFTMESMGHHHHHDFHEDHDFVTAVPEPETFALMLAGLALVGWSVRRRQQG